ncbi:uncharacterized protein LOC143646800 [Tamandua tetradactyla]|uniref:uncharacterized protein LOC143646800 n=1 Tax=Tamandua tetradactyla TaxID=48850 RepID=UPI004054918A
MWRSLSPSDRMSLQWMMDMGEKCPLYNTGPFPPLTYITEKNNNPPFSEAPTRLTGLVESLMFSHQPTWDDCQQLLGTRFTTEERDRILLEARKQVPGQDGRPTQLQHIIDDRFPLRRPNWDPNTPEGREHLSIYRQTLVAGLRAAARRPTNLAKIDPETGSSNQLTWTRLPQGFKNSPTIFDEALHKDLSSFRIQHPRVTLLQYVDDLLLAADTKEDCEYETRKLLNKLAALGNRASAKKAQICKKEVISLGYTLKNEKR